MTIPQRLGLGLALAVVLGGVVFWRPSNTATPVLPLFPLNPTSQELQAVCTAQGHLQLLAKYTGDPITAFELLDLDPYARPFAPSRHSRRRGNQWHKEVIHTVEQRHADLIAAASQQDATGHSDPDGDRYKAALSAASSMLSQDGSRQFYVDTFLPALDLVLRGHQRQTWCAWPRVRAFHRQLCAATWPTTGMLELVRASPDGGLGALVNHCFDLPLFPASSGMDGKI
jgi:hypothetical protein